MLAMNNKSFFWGTIAKWMLTRHYRYEVKPYAMKHNHKKDEVKKAAHAALDRLFDKAWDSQ